MNIKQGLTAIASGSVLLGSLAFAGTAFAAAPQAGMHDRSNVSRPTIGGIVASVSGNTFTITRGLWRGHASTTPATTTYTVDATNATVTKDGATSTVSAIVIGDQVMIQGTVSGTNVVATKIFDSKTGHTFGRSSEERPAMNTASHTPIAQIQGNGQPVIGGKVTAVSGSTLTVTTASGIVYSVDASTAKVDKRDVTTATIANVSIGDTIVVQGTVAGTSVTASSVIDHGSIPAIVGGSDDDGPRGGIMNTIGGFFAHLFGF